MGADYKKKQSSIIGGYNPTVQGANTQRFYFPYGSDGRIAEADARMFVPFDCILTHFYSRAGAPPGAGETFDYVVLLNGNVTALALQIAGAVNQTAGPDLSGVAILAGEEICIRIITSAGAAVNYHMWSLEVNT